VLHAIARTALAAPRRIIAIAALVMVAAAIFGIPVVSSLQTGGFKDPASESSRAAQLLAEKFGHGDMSMVIALTAADGVHGGAAQDASAQVVTLLEELPYVADVQSAWTAPPQAAPAMVSRDGKTGLIVVGLTGTDNEAQKHAGEIAKMLPHFADVTVTAGGEALSNTQIVEQTLKDLLVMEVIAIPLSFIVLVLVFGGLLAAALPVGVGLFAIVGAMAVLRAFTFVTDVSIFALNLALALGLALAIDYTLLIISRFRDEIAAGATRDEALVHTMLTAGRTVLFSATTVALAMVAMILFPIYFLKSFAYTGIGVVAFAAAASVIVTPAVLVVLGERLDALDVRRWIRRVLNRPEAVVRPVEQNIWYRVSKVAMRHAIPVAMAVIALLLMLGAPLLGIKWAYPDDRALPDSMSSRALGDLMRSDFDINSVNDVMVVVPDLGKTTPDDVDAYAGRLSEVPDVTAVSSPGGTFVGGHRVGPAAAATGVASGSAFVTVHSTAPLYSAASDNQLGRLHAVATPAGTKVAMSGWAQFSRDCAHAVTSRLPLVLAVMATITALLLFMMTGSVVLPLKALLLNVLSLMSAFGALVWVFQNGHLGGLGTTATGTMVASVLVLLFCLTFGLSMDYELFLLSRIREFWLASAKTVADSRESVARGLAHTGRVVTAAAVLMAVTFGAMVTGQVSTSRIFGVGITLAVLVDATLVRMLLVPAFMRLLGTAAWWAPRPLAALHERFGLSESDRRTPRRPATIPSDPEPDAPVPAFA
jgi:putative drug exporter of the RND superfamily